MSQTPGVGEAYAGGEGLGPLTPGMSESWKADLAEPRGLTQTGGALDNPRDTPGLAGRPAGSRGVREASYVSPGFGSEATAHVRNTYWNYRKVHHVQGNADKLLPQTP